MNTKISNYKFLNICGFNNTGTTLLVDIFLNNNSVYNLIKKYEILKTNDRSQYRKSIDSCHEYFFFTRNFLIFF